MRIAMVARALPRADNAGGVSGQVHLLANALAHRGNEVTVYALNPPCQPPLYDYRPIPIPSRLLSFPRLAIYLTPFGVRSLPLDDYDVVHTHGDDHFVHTRKPVLRTFYGSSRAEARYSPRLRHKLYHLSMVPFELISERRATRVVTISQDGQRYLTRRAVIIPCGYDPTVFFPAEAKSGRPSILFVGDLGTRKRGDLLLEVFARVVRATVPTAELWMVTTERVAAPGVRWFGRVPTTTLVELYQQAWVFCLPSLYEGFGVPYLEAMACGTPVVATLNGGAEEVLAAGAAGRIVAEGEIGPEIVRLLADSSARQAVANLGLARVGRYAISRIATQYEALYQEMAEHS